MYLICPVCEEKREVEEVQKKEVLVIKGETIELEVIVNICDKCGEEFIDPSSDIDVVEEAFRQYRNAKGMIQPENIKLFRKKYGLTQKELSDLLGWGAVTISRYENGALQDDAHDKMLKLVMHPNNLLQIIRENPEAIHVSKRKEVINKLLAEKAEILSIWNAYEEKFSVEEPNEFSGYMKLNYQKICNAVVYLSGEEGVVKTKLNKLLFYLDFMHFKQNSVSITGLQYAKLPYGPVPEKYELLYSALDVEKGAIRIEEEMIHGYPGEVIKANVKPDLSVFTASELKFLIEVKEKFDDSTATEISKESHKELGYKKTKNSSLISYKFADKLND